MNMFRQSELNDDELIQANRLEDALSEMFRGDESRIDRREDPELSELTSLGQLLRSTADEATSRGSFNSFHMRSRSALLHQIAELRQSSVTTGFVGSVLDFVRVRSTIISGVGASLATALVFLIFSSFGAPSSEISAATNVENVDPSIETQQVSSQTTENSAREITSVQLAASSSGSKSSDIDSMNIAITGLIAGTTEMRRSETNVNVSGSSVEVIQSSPYTLSIGSLEDAIVSLELASIDGVVTVDMVRQVTDELARVGFEMRSGHPGAKTASDIEDFQNAIVRAILVLQGIEQSDKNVQASLIAAKIVAEEGMYITTMYVNANQASR
jgi:hypothetical protein